MRSPFQDIVLPLRSICQSIKLGTLEINNITCSAFAREGRGRENEKMKQKKEHSKNRVNLLFFFYLKILFNVLYTTFQL